MEEISKSILNDIERDKIIKFAEDKMALDAVKKYVLAVALKQGVFEKGKEFVGNMNWALQLSWGATEPNGVPRSDEELGQNLRALTLAVKLVESGFKEIAEFKKEVEPLVDNENPAE